MHSNNFSTCIGGVFMAFTNIMGYTYIDLLIKGAIGGIAGWLGKEIVLWLFRRAKQFIKKVSTQNQKTK